MDLHLQGKRALVTGASRGLGYATALGLAKEGVSVAVNSRDTGRIAQAAENIQSEAGTKGIFAIAGDISADGTPSNVVTKAVKALGGLDILVTNAGGPPAGKFEGIDEETWAKAIDLSLMSHVRLIRAALPHLYESEAASVLTITSYSVKQPVPNLVLSNSIRVLQQWG